LQTHDQSALCLCASLTPREREVLAALSTGASNKDICRQLGIAFDTVKIHVQSIYRKLGVHNRTKAALWAAQHGECLKQTA
jgi:DNA-binding NarL/FixJ family response regulator